MISQEGPGWRLAWDPLKEKFPILLGGEGWAFELAEAEWETLVQLVFDLTTEHQQIKSQLMEEESVRLEMEKEFWWGCLEGDKDNWTLQVILQPYESNIRAVEAFWTCASAKKFSSAMKMMWDSYQGLGNLIA